MNVRKNLQVIDPKVSTIFKGRNYLLAFFRKAYLIPLVIIETLGNFVVIALWLVYV